MNWTAKQLKKVGLVNNLESNYTPTEKVSVQKNTIKTILWVLQREGTIPGYEAEYPFHPTRKFRFDWAIVSLKIGIEYEGVISTKSRHTTMKGYSNDCEKYNQASILGWKVLRYTALNYKDLEKDLKNLIGK